MTTIELERERQLIDLLEHAIDQPEEKRREELEKVCDDSSLVEEALMLLDDEDDDFLTKPAVEELMGSLLVDDARDVRSLLGDDNELSSTLAN